MNELVVSQNLVPSDVEMAIISMMAKQASESKMYRGIGDQAGLLMIMLAARELNIGPIQALNGGLNIINGKVEISARMMNAMIRRAGHSIKIKESTDDKCVLSARRCDTGDVAEVMYTIEDAKKAGLIKAGGGWTKNPKDMCFARCLSRIARQLFADVIGIGYVEGEISNPQMMEAESKVIEEDEVCNVELKEDEIESWKEYYDTVKKHFGWTDKRVNYEFNKNISDTYSKFQKWKNKGEKNES